MNVTEMWAAVKGQLGYASTATIGRMPDSEEYWRLNQALRDVARVTKYLPRLVSIPLTSGTPTYALPVDVIDYRRDAGELALCNTVGGWTVVTGYPNAYSTATSSVLAITNVWTTPDSVVFTPITQAASYADCLATSNSWWWAAGTLTLNLGGTDPGTLTVVTFPGVTYPLENVTITDIRKRYGGNWRDLMPPFASFNNLYRDGNTVGLWPTPVFTYPMATITIDCRVMPYGTSVTGTTPYPEVSATITSPAWLPEECHMAPVCYLVRDVALILGGERATDLFQRADAEYKRMIGLLNSRQ